MSRQGQPSTPDAISLRLLAQVAEIRERIGGRIKIARESQRRDDGTPWTQNDLARALAKYDATARVEASSISRWETGKVRPGEDVIEAIAAATGHDFEFFYVENPVVGTNDLMGALSSNDPAQLDRIESMLRELLEIARRQSGGDPTQLAEGLRDLPGPDTHQPVPAPGESQQPQRRRRAV